jgi:MFS family permease
VKPSVGAGPFRDRTTWYLGVSAYWFATSFKWFALLLVLLPGQVARIVPDGEKNTYWGMVFGIGALWAVVGPSLFGYISDRTLSRFGRRRPFIAVGAGLTVLALAVLSEANSLAFLIAGYLLLQISDDVGTGPYGAIVPELVPRERRGLASGMLSLGKLSAQVAAGISIILLAQNITAMYAVVAVLNVACALATVWALRGEGIGVPEPSARRSFFAAWATPWRSRDFRWVWASSFLMALAFYLVQPYLQNFLRDVVGDFQILGLDLGSTRTGTEAERSTAAFQATAGLALLISLIGGLSALVAARWIDRLGRKPVIAASGILIFAALVPFALSSSFGVIVALGAIFGVGYGVRLSAEWALISDVIPNADEAGTQMGVWAATQSSVQIFAGATGALIDMGNRMGDGAGYRFAFLLAAVLFLTSTLAVRPVQGTR